MFVNIPTIYSVNVYQTGSSYSVVHIWSQSFLFVCYKLKLFLFSIISAKVLDDFAVCNLGFYFLSNDSSYIINNKWWTKLYVNRINFFFWTPWGHEDIQSARQQLGINWFLFYLYNKIGKQFLSKHKTFSINYIALVFSLFISSSN